jgi:hypothetical protein
MCDEGGRVGSIDRSSGPEKMKPTEAAFAMAKFSVPVQGSKRPGAGLHA